MYNKDDEDEDIRYMSTYMNYIKSMEKRKMERRRTVTFLG
jgi:hypothetical protein